MTNEQQSVTAILKRIDYLERENAWLKRGLAAVVIGGSLMFLMGQARPGATDAGGGQHEPKAARQKVAAQAPYWKLSDGRLVVFPRSVEVEKVDGASLDLPSGTRVIGWEPVEGATSLLPAYAQRVATIPTLKSRMDAVASAAEILQQEVTNFKVELRAAQGAALKDENTANENTKIYNANIADLDFRLRRLELDNLAKRDLDDLKKALDDFKDAVCPFLRGRDVSWTTKMKVDSACGFR